MEIWEPYPSFYDWPEAVNDVGLIPISIERMRLVSKAVGFDLLPRLPNLRDLWCFDVKVREFSNICSCSSLRRLFIDGLKVDDLACLGNMERLETLSLEGCSTVRDLSELGKRSNLTSLGIINFKNISSIEEVGKLLNLRQLVVAGSMWTTMRLETLRPLSRLTNLVRLDLGNTRVDDGSLRPLGKLQNLKILNLPNFHSVDEFAWLSRQLPNTDCTWFKPVIDFENFPCKKCGKHTLKMLSGKGASTLCRSCDLKRIEKHIERFERAAN